MIWQQKVVVNKLFGEFNMCRAILIRPEQYTLILDFIYIPILSTNACNMNCPGIKDVCEFSYKPLIWIL